jgi:hypothetical protein
MRRSQAVIDLWQVILPQCHKDARIWQLLYILPAAWITGTGSDCPGLSNITANDLTLSLAKLKKRKIYNSPQRLRVQNAIKLHTQASCRTDKWAPCARTHCNICEIAIILPKAL